MCKILHRKEIYTDYLLLYCAMLRCVQVIHKGYIPFKQLLATSIKYQAKGQYDADYCFCRFLRDLTDCTIHMILL